MFDIIKRGHVSTGHGGRGKVMKVLNQTITIQEISKSRKPMLPVRQ